MFACLYCYFQNVASFSIVAQNSPGSMIFPEFQKNKNVLNNQCRRKRKFCHKEFQEKSKSPRFSNFLKVRKEGRTRFFKLTEEAFDVLR